MNAPNPKSPPNGLVRRVAKPEKPIGMLGAIAIAIGVGVLGAYALDYHRHRCESCGRTWRHLGAFNMGDPASHTCSCGTVQWWKDGVPHVFRSVLRTPPPDPYAELRKRFAEKNSG